MCTLSVINIVIILNTLGQSIPDNVSSHTVLPSPVDDISNIPGITKRVYVIKLVSLFIFAEEKKFQIEDLIKSGILTILHLNGVYTDFHASVFIFSNDTHWQK